MENSKKNQEMELRDLSQEELMTVYGGTSFQLVFKDGKLIYVPVEG